MRPNSIVLFDRLFLAIMLIGVIGGAVNWHAATATMTNSPALGVFGSGGFYGILIGSIVVGLGINLLLWYFISRRASGTARWIWVVLFAVGVPSTVSNILGLSTLVVISPAARGIVGVNLGLHIVALIVLFRPDARAWLASGGKGYDADVFS